MALFKLIHLLSVLIWVGGMFFAYMVLRPAAVEVLELPHRLSLWDAVFRRFFNWVWAIIAIILISGLYMIYLGDGMQHAARYVQFMLASGIAMTVVFGYVYFACYVPLSLHVANQNWTEAAEKLGKIRKLIALNLSLGLLIVGIVAIGRVWS